jgi:hypothetical protein
MADIDPKAPAPAAGPDTENENFADERGEVEKDP